MRAALLYCGLCGPARHPALTGRATNRRGPPDRGYSTNSPGPDIHQLAKLRWLGLPERAHSHDHQVPLSLALVGEVPKKLRTRLGYEAEFIGDVECPRSGGPRQFLARPVRAGQTFTPVEYVRPGRRPGQPSHQPGV